MPDRYIFLDIDGVLHSLDACRQFHPTLLDRLRQIVQVTRAHIVLSSSWRLRPTGIEQVTAALASVGIPAPISCTPQDDNPYDRHREVCRWLQHKAEYDNFVVLDDLPMPQLSPHFIQVNPLQGLSEANAAAAIEQLTANNCIITPDLLDSIIAAPRQVSQQAEVMARFHQSAPGGAADNDGINQLLQQLFKQQFECDIGLPKPAAPDPIAAGLARLKRMQASGELRGSSAEGETEGSSAEGAMDVRSSSKQNPPVVSSISSMARRLGCHAGSRLEVLWDLEEEIGDSKRWWPCTLKSDCSRTVNIRVDQDGPAEQLAVWAVLYDEISEMECTNDELVAEVAFLAKDSLIDLDSESVLPWRFESCPPAAAQRVALGDKLTACKPPEGIPRQPNSSLALAENVTEMGGERQSKVCRTNKHIEPKQRISKFKQARMAGKETGSYAPKGQDLNM